MKNERLEWGIAGDPEYWGYEPTVFSGSELLYLASHESDIVYYVTVYGDDTVLNGFVDAVVGWELDPKVERKRSDYIKAVKAMGDACETLYNLYYEYLAHTYHGKRNVELQCHNARIVVSSVKESVEPTNIRSSRREIFLSSRRYQKASRCTKRSYVRLQIPSFRERFWASNVVVARNFPLTDLEKCIAWSIALDYADNGCLGRTDCCNGGEQ